MLQQDITAEQRMGYLAAREYGTLFVENRYTDFGNYYPHRTLRNLWMLARYVPAQRMLFELLNPARNTERYRADPLAPGRYTADYLFASVMAAQPLLWMELSGLGRQDAARLQPVSYTHLVQTIVYMPHFISAVVVVSLINAMLSPSNGLFNQIIQMFGGDPVHFMAEPKYFKTVYVLSDIWQTAGYGSIVYLAALTSIDPSLYEAATVDGASKWKKLLHITLPCILPTIMTMLILRMGSIFTVGYEKIMLMYNPATYETADVISTYVYRRAFEGGEYSFSAAVGLFLSLIHI